MIEAQRTETPQKDNRHDWKHPQAQKEGTDGHEPEAGAMKTGLRDRSENQEARNDREEQRDTQGARTPATHPANIASQRVLAATGPTLRNTSCIPLPI